MSKEKILIVDDTNAIRILVSKIVEKMGYEPIVASNGMEGLSMLTMYPEVKLVLLDIMMPKMDGFEFLQRAQLLPSINNHKICMLTAIESEENIRKTLEYGANDYTTKPIDRSIIIDKNLWECKGFRLRNRIFWSRVRKTSERYIIIG